MSIELTEQQQQALDLQAKAPLRVIDPRSNAAYYLIPAADYEAIQEGLENERREKAIRAAGLRNAVGRMESEP
jgi:PHD/YefM family antitoxin component YafN of YafNO toxin-antitoxin module